MNCQEAKNIDLIQYLKKLGIEPQKTKRENQWFLSPFRAEKTASFKVNTNKNIWYDFGEGCGGTIIDFLQKLHNCSIVEALKKLENGSFSFHQQPQKKDQTKNYNILQVKNINNKHLIVYLKQRKLNLDFVKQFCCEVYFSFDSKKTYYAIGFKNDLSGFELRNHFFKGCVGKKSITTIKRDFCTVSIFESWSDFLSYITLKKEIPNEDYIILNSTALIKNALELLPNYDEIKPFFDNDKAGDKAFQIIQENTKKEIFDYRMYYKNHNDLNDYLINRKSEQV